MDGIEREWGVPPQSVNHSHILARGTSRAFLVNEFSDGACDYSYVDPFSSNQAWKSLSSDRSPRSLHFSRCLRPFG